MKEREWEYMGREIKFDIMRIILIILVVLGHSTFYSINTPFGGIDYEDLMKKALIVDTMSHRIMAIISSAIYTFHMPAFICLSGLFFSKQIKKNKWTLKNLVQTKLKKLILPCVFIWFFWNLPVKLLSGYYIDISIKNMILQIIFPEKVYLWYLEALFFCFIFAYLLKNVRLKWMCIIIFWLIGCFINYWNTNYILFGNPLKWLLWFEFGMHIEIIMINIKKYNTSNFYIFAILALIWIICFGIQKIPDSEIIFYMLKETILPFSGILMLNLICDLLSNMFSSENSDMLCKISSYGFGIYLWAEPLNYLILAIFYNVGGINCFGNEFISIILILLRILITPIIAIVVVNLLRKIKFKILCY